MTRASKGIPAELEAYAAQRYSAAGGRVPRGEGGVNTGYVLDESLSILLPAYRKRRAADTAAASAPGAATEAPQSDLFTGALAGVVRTENGDVPLSLSVRASGDIHAKLGSQLETLLNQPRFRDGRLSGIMTGDLGVGATALKLYLFMREGVLKGTAVTDPSPQLPHWVELKREQ